MKNFDQLPAASALSGPEVFPLNQAGVTKHATINQILDLIGLAFDPTGTADAVMNAHTGLFDHDLITHANRTALDQVLGVNTGDQDIAAWFNANGAALLAGITTTGTWIPLDLSGDNLTIPIYQDCRWMKVGRHVTVTGRLTTPVQPVNTGNPAKIGGFPFNVLSPTPFTTYNQVGSVLYQTGVVWPSEGLGAYFSLYNNAGTATGRNNWYLYTAGIGPGATIWFTFSFIATE